MLGRTPEGILAVRPLKDGVIADFDVTEKMLRYFLKTIIDKHVFRVKPKVIVCVPSGITEVERRAVRDSAETAGAKQVLHGGRADGRRDRRRPAGRDADRQHGDRHRRRHHRDRGHRALRHRLRHLDPHRRRRAGPGHRPVHAEELQPADRRADRRGDQDQDRLRGAHGRRARDGGQGPRPRVRHPQDGAGALDRDPRGGAGADPADRGRRAPGAGDHAARAGQRHRGPRASS